ncbi:myosin IB heavy chain [Brachypodium distachyon]|uniref:TH1 domain-containing protein n=2 Tax=Brachypodium distachyon TaxID=15368 RepID=I1HPI4_BRADI|nr:myosin IB heavy chain [Brachypodium distachyon]KQK08787.1 hypothetical protein BRADI_2g43870v3 [Brachypodium distachyon]|eukprot:XP_003569383.1 myosin IB heavy chain [Brachypodium distachyon]
MDRFRPLRRIQVEPERADPPPPAPPAAGGGEAEEMVPGPAAGLLMGAKVRRRAAVYRDCKGDYIGVPNDPCLAKILSKQGDNKVLFADKVLKFTQSGKMKRRILVITDFALYLVDPDADILKRRIALAAVDRLCISNLSDNFFAIIVPTEYDCLMVSTRKKEIVDIIVRAIKSTSEYEPEVASSNRFEYHAAAEVIKEVEFEEADGGIKTRITHKEK